MESELAREDNESIMSTSISSEAALMRAAEISSMISSITLGPNASPPASSGEENKENRLTNGHRRSSGEKKHILKHSDAAGGGGGSKPGHRLDISDVKNFQQKMHHQNVSKRIEMDVRRKLEQKRLEEIEKHNEIRRNLEAMKAETERRHRLKMEEFERKVQQELELERHREKAYQEQRKQLAANTRKIQEEKEKVFREQIRKWEEIFARQDAIFSKMLSACIPDFESLDAFKKELKTLQDLKEANKSSLDGVKSACIKLDALSQRFQKELVEFVAARKEAEEREKQIQAAAAAAEVAAAAAAANAQKQLHESVTPIQIVAISPQAHDQIDQVPAGDSNSLQLESFKLYSDYMQLLGMKKNQTRRLDETPELQQFRFALKFAINNSVNLLNEKNKSTLLDGYQKLFSLLSGQRVNTAKGSVSIMDHNEASDWCKLRIAEKLIDRCDKESSIVFFSAAIASALWKKFPDFGDIFKALLFKECPFLLPHKPTKLSSQSNEDFLSSWGFRLNNGLCESHAHYEGRTNKFAALMAAAWITAPRNGEADTPFNISFGWRYLATVLDSPPDSNYLHIIGKLLEIAGFMMHKVYGKQFVKLMLIIREKYIPAVHSSVDEETSASFNRLREAVASFFHTKQFSPPQGYLPQGYW